MNFVQYVEQIPNITIAKRTPRTKVWGIRFVLAPQPSYSIYLGNMATAIFKDAERILKQAQAKSASAYQAASSQAPRH